jgi:hypothetical protein
MRDFLLLYWSPFKKENSEVKISKHSTYEDAVIKGDEKRKLGYDAVVIRSEKQTYIDESVEQKYYIERYGYYKTYKFLNTIIFLFTFIILVFFCYLYYKFLI